MTTFCLKKIQVTAYSVSLFFCCIFVFAANNQAQGTSTEEKILQISSPDAIQTIYDNAKGVADRITVIEQLTDVVNRFKVNASLSTPIWLYNILGQALNSGNMEESYAAINQIASLKVVSLADALLDRFNQSGVDEISRIRILNALGLMGYEKVIPILKDIISKQVISFETIAALSAASNLCAVELAGTISSYVKNLDTRIKSGEFNTNDPKSRPVDAPENTLAIATSALKKIGNCGQ